MKGHGRLVIDLNKSKNTSIDTNYLDKCLLSIKNGDLSYMSDLYNLTSKSIYSYALSILRNKEDAEDVTHDCYVIVYKSIHQYSSKGKPLSWLITITRNLALARLNEKSKIDDREIEEFNFPMQEGMSATDRDLINTCMNLLNQEERQVIILHAVSGFKHREIAHIMNMSLSGVLSKYNRAIKKVRAHLQKGMLYE